MRPGMASILMPNDGTVKEWMTSAVGVDDSPIAAAWRWSRCRNARGRASGAMLSDLLEPLGRGDDARQFDAQEAPVTSTCTIRAFLLERGLAARQG